MAAGRWPSSCTRSVATRHSESGMSLVEALVAIMLLGIIFSAAASSLIQFMREAATNERRVQASALLTRMHEELQMVPWDSLGIYEEDLDAVEDPAALGLSKNEAGEWLFEGDEVVVLAGPGAAGRRSGVPELQQELTARVGDDGTVTHDTFDERPYDVLRVVTWSDEDRRVRRITTVAVWQTANRDFEERFVSERAGPASVVDDGPTPAVESFIVDPAESALVDVPDGEVSVNDELITFTLLLTEGIEGTPTVSYPVLEFTGEEGEDSHQITTRTDDMVAEGFQAGTGLDNRFTYSIPARSTSFVTGPRTFTAFYSGEDAALTAEVTVEFYGGFNPEAPDGEDPEAPPEDGTEEEPLTPPDHDLEVLSFAVQPALVCQDADDHFTQEVIVRAWITGLVPEDHDVEIIFKQDDPDDPGVQITKRRDMVPQSQDTFSSTNAEFTYEFSADVDHDFRLVGNNANQEVRIVDFTVEARRSSDASQDALSSDSHNGPTRLEIRRVGGNSCR